jgi:hypothetical protein
MDPDSLYYHPSMKEPDKAKFIKAIQKELDGHFKEKNYTLPRSKSPKNALVLQHVSPLIRKGVIKSKSLH